MTAPAVKCTSHRYTSRPLALLAGCLLAGALTVAQAAPPAGAASSEAAPRQVVNYSDLDLASPEGTLALYRRIATAAQKVCPPESSRDLARKARIDACRSEAIARAVRDINNSRLAALYAQRSNRG
jgi:UrcA family protein